MRRAPIVLTATAVGVAAVLAFNPRPATRGSIAEAPLPNLTAPGAEREGIFLGPSVANRYGTVQVQVAMTAGKVVDVRAVQLPANDGKSQQISRQAGPRLKQQALTAQTASIDGVSGATYTSDGYRQSLQAALDHAGAPTSTGQA
jgi:uncharacterized protein with FMN-binding domain